MKSCKVREKIVMIKYYKRFVVLYLILFIGFIITSILFVVITNEFTLKKFLVDVTYPFKIESKLIFALVYVHQLIGMLQNYFLMYFDFIVVALFWYVGARLKLLGLKLGMIKKDEELRDCIVEHQRIIRY